MDPYLRRVFCFHIVQQALVAQIAYDRLVVLLGQPSGGAAQMFVEIQNFLTATANMGKALWTPSSNKVAGAPNRLPLRQLLGVTENSPLKDIGLRHSFEHFDERIDQWWVDPDRFGFADMNVSDDDGEQVFEKPGPKDMLRQFNPVTGRLFFWDVECNVHDVAREAKSIGEQAQAATGIAAR